MPHEEQLELDAPRTDEDWEGSRWECDHCGEEAYDDTPSTEIEGETWCSDCTESDAATCQRCDASVNSENMREVDCGWESSEQWCEACVDAWSVSCERCDDLCNMDHTCTVDNESWCRDCEDSYAFFCDHCEEYSHMESAVRVHNDTSVCQCCYESHFFTCEGCSEVFNNDDDCGDGDYCCESCHEEREDDSVGSWDASEHMNLHFHYVVPAQNNSRLTALYFGVETEVECTNAGHMEVGEIARELLNCDGNNFFYTMSDSTLDDGFEIATHPFTWDWAKQHRDWWEPLYELSRWCTAYDELTCGMHVHMSRKAFSKTHLLKFTRFFFENPGFITRISRRREDKLADRGCTLWEDASSMISRAKGDVGGNRAAIAFDAENTIECRIFRSTLTPRGYWANVGFLKALYDFTAEASMADISSEKFIGWVKSRAQNYGAFLDVFGDRLPSKSKL